MIDLHCHLLPGIDDGPVTMEDSIALARGAAAAQIREIVATPHVNGRYPNQAASIADKLETVEASIAAAGLPLKIHFGAEIAISALPEIPDSQLASLALGNGSGWLLIEPPFAPVARGIDTVLLGLHEMGYRVVLAHPERCPVFHRDPRALDILARAGILMSITAGSLTGRFGRRVEAFALGLADAGLIHNVASDAHDCANRPPGLSKEIRRAGLATLAEWLTRSVPSAVLAGEPVPPRPTTTVRPRRFGWASIVRPPRRA